MTLVLRTRTAWRSFLGLYLAAGVLAVAIWVVGFKSGIASGPVVVGVGWAPVVLAVLYSWLVRLSREYRLYEDSLEVESGILARRIEQIQLFRVRDLGLSQSILARMTGVGDLVVTSTDQSAPHLRLRGIDDPRGVFERLREFVSKSQATRRTMIVEQER